MNSVDNSAFLPQQQQQQSHALYNFSSLSSESLPLAREGQAAANSLAFDHGMDGIADASRTLFLGDLSYFCKEEDICNLFAEYGPISTVRVRRGVTGESLMHGFVALETAEAAHRAIAALDGVEFMGRNLRVQLSSDGQRPAPGAKDKLVQVHVSFISKQTSTLICEKVLREIFCAFGQIADVTIKKHSVLPKQHRQSGYGFVFFFEAPAAYRAMHSLKHSTVREITLDCSISHKSEHMIKNQQPRQNSNGLPPAPSSPAPAMQARYQSPPKPNVNQRGFNVLMEDGLHKQPLGVHPGRHSPGAIGSGLLGQGMDWLSAPSLDTFLNTKLAHERDADCSRFSGLFARSYDREKVQEDRGLGFSLSVAHCSPSQRQQGNTLWESGSDDSFSDSQTWSQSYQSPCAPRNHDAASFGLFPAHVKANCDNSSFRSSLASSVDQEVDLNFSLSLDEALDGLQQYQLQQQASTLLW
eukprot:scaffold2858_cov245-Ochromonas_danica.AAC.21